MKILYYTWNEIIKTDVIQTFIKMGYEVSFFEYELKSYIKDVEFLERLESELNRANQFEKGYDFIFSCNFIPLISKIALRNKTPYVCWIYDSPCMTMYSEMVFNPYNYMFHFDLSEVERVKKLGVSHIYHLPLAVNIERVNNVIKQATTVSWKYVNNGVAFMGNLYNDEVDFIESIAGLPDYEKGYMKSLELAQLTMPGTDLIEELFDDYYNQRLNRYVSFSKEKEFFIKDTELALNMIKKNISSMERIKMLEILSSKCDVTLYSDSKKQCLPAVRKRGYIDYMKEMPVMFANSKVNLNITLRNIKKGNFLMNILIFEYNNFGTEDVKECLEKKGYKYTVVETDEYRNRVSPEFDRLFEEKFSEGINGEKYDCVFTFNYSPVISNNCKARNVPYIALVYDSPQVLLYSYTIINTCNYVFIFDKTQYMELKKEGINTVYYVPLAVNTDRMKRMSAAQEQNRSRFTEVYGGDIAFVGAMYNEKHNLYDKLDGISDFTRGYLDSVMNAQRKVYGHFFLEEVLNGEILKDMLNSLPLEPNNDGVETIQYLYADYFLARKMANDDRTEIMSRLGRDFGKEYMVNLFTFNETPMLLNVNNRGPVDYYNDMPYIFNNTRINLNITLRSIKSGIPLRGMDVMGAGGFLMSNYQADYYDWFVPGEDMVMYESVDDLSDKCRYYLSHDNERKQIAANGYGKISEFHTYDVRFKEMFDVVFN